MGTIKEYRFSKYGANQIKQSEYGMNWPIVYLIHNEREVYIGQSSNAYVRTNQHLKNEERSNLKKIKILTDKTMNLSGALDIESLFIQYIEAEHHYKLQNRISGHNLANDYYERPKYLKLFEEFWDKLRKEQFVKERLIDINNTPLFKFSPYKSMSTDQYTVCNQLLFSLVSNFNKKSMTYFIQGGAGTGKTVMAVFMMKLLYDCIHIPFDMEELDRHFKNEDNLYTIAAGLRNYPDFEFALVIPLPRMRKTLKSVFAKTQGLSASMVIGPNDVTKKKYDLLIVDEAHRLKRRKNLSGYASFDKTNTLLGLGNEGTELDWIMNSSKYQIFFYDEKQSVKPSDVEKQRFKDLRKLKNIEEYSLNLQMRVLGGDRYIDYIHHIFSDCPPHNSEKFEEYDFKLFDNLVDMVNEIRSKEDTYKLSRITAGYAWPWKTKDMNFDEIKKKDLEDFNIDGYSCIWNTVNGDWVGSEHAIDEIGCIHSIQGYDLNFAGVIIGNELTYNKREQRLEIRPENYYDINGKRGINDIQQLKDYILNIYHVLMTRGIRGTYVYVCDKDLKEYLENYINR